MPIFLPLFFAYRAGLRITIIFYIRIWLIFCNPVDTNRPFHYNYRRYMAQENPRLKKINGKNDSFLNRGKDWAGLLKRSILYTYMSKYIFKAGVNAVKELLAREDVTFYHDLALTAQKAMEADAEKAMRIISGSYYVKLRKGR